MARSKKNNLSGKAGGLIFYERNGKSYARSRPDKVNQTNSTKAAALNFGNVKTLSGKLREGFSTVIPDYKSTTLMYHVDEAIRSWLRDCYSKGFGRKDSMPYLDGLSLNLKSPALQALLPGQVNVNWSGEGQVLIQLPSFYPKKMAAPPHPTGLQWRIEVAVVGMTGSLIMRDWPANTAIDIPFTDQQVKEQVVELPLTLEPGAVHAVALSLRYFTGKGEKKVLVDDRKWWPCGIVGSCYMPV